LYSKSVSGRIVKASQNAIGAAKNIIKNGMVCRYARDGDAAGTCVNRWMNLDWVELARCRRRQGDCGGREGPILRRKS